MSEFDFIEKQYLGLNKMSLSRRISLAIFCLVAYYWRENHDKAGELYFFIGITIMVISMILIFILHLSCSLFVYLSYMVSLVVSLSFSFVRYLRCLL